MVMYCINRSTLDMLGCGCACTSSTCLHYPPLRRLPPPHPTPIHYLDMNGSNAHPPLPPSVHTPAHTARPSIPCHAMPSEGQPQQVVQVLPAHVDMPVPCALLMGSTGLLPCP